MLVLNLVRTSAPVLLLHGIMSCPLSARTSPVSFQVLASPYHPSRVLLPLPFWVLLYDLTVISFPFFLITAMPTGVRRRVHVVLTCVSPTISDVEHLFTGPLAIVCLLRFAAHCLFLNPIVRLFFLLLGSMNSLYILHVNPLSDTAISNYFFQFRKLPVLSVFHLESLHWQSHFGKGDRLV